MRLKERGLSSIFIVLNVIVGLIGLIAVYAVAAEPIQKFKNEILERMTAHTGPIDNFWLIFQVAGVALFIIILLWAVLAAQEDEYKKRRTAVPLAIGGIR